MINTRIYGFFSSFFQIIDNLKYCEDHNLKPIINIGDLFLYQNNTIGKDTWNNFFEDINDYELEGDPVFLDNIDPGGVNAYFLNEDFILSRGPNNEHLSTLWKIYNEKNSEELLKHRVLVNHYIHKYIKPTEFIIQSVNNFADKYLKETSNILSVHVRATDYMLHDMSVYINKIKEILAVEAYDIIYVASDSEEALQILKEQLPNVCCLETPRRQQFLSTPVPACHIVSGEDKIKHGQDVLIESILLSRGKRLVCINSNVAAAAAYFNPSLNIDLLAKSNFGG